MKTTRRIASLLLCIVMVLGILTLPGMTANAAGNREGVIPGTTGTGTKNDPVVVKTFAELKAAMESSTIGYVRLVGAQREVLPIIDEYASAIRVDGPNKEKHLSIEGNTTYIASAASEVYDSLIHVTTNVTLEVSGTGSLAFYPNGTNAFNAVIRNDGRCHIQDVTLIGDLGQEVYAYAVVNTNGILAIDSGNFYGTTALNTTGPFAAVRVAYGRGIIRGGKFHSSIASGYNVSAGTNALTVAAGATCTVTGGTFYSGIYAQNSSVSSILGDGCMLTDANGRKISASQSRYNSSVMVVQTYDCYIDMVQITDLNKKDVFGDGKVRFYPRGEYASQSAVLELNDFIIYENSGLGYHEYEKNKYSAMYFGEDTIVRLNGANFVMGDGEYDGIVTGEGCELQFAGSGMLYVDMGTENVAVLAPGGTITMWEQADVNLYGSNGLEMPHAGGDVTVQDNAFLFCYGYQRENGSDGYGFVGKGITLTDHGEFTAESQFNGEAIYTWVEAYPSSVYDIKILKKGEYTSAYWSWDHQAHQPYLIQNGLNTAGGVGESQCRYINMKVKNQETPSLIKQVYITDMDEPVVGQHPDMTFSIDKGSELGLQGSVVWMRYNLDGSSGVRMKSSDVFQDGYRYSCYLYIESTQGRCFSWKPGVDEYGDEYNVFDGFLFVNDSSVMGYITDSGTRMTAFWWAGSALPGEKTTDCGGDPGKCAISQFKDVPGYSNWAHKGIEYCVVNGLMSGTSSTAFSPKTSMSRAMLVTVLYRMAGQPGAGQSKFSDVPANQWYSAAVSWAADKGIVSGVGGGRFDPNGNVTREQIATILFRYASFKGYNTSNRNNLAGFADAGKVGSWFIDGMQWAVAEGLITGTVTNNKTYLNPQGAATREQVAAILMRFCENVAK